MMQGFYFYTPRKEYFFVTKQTKRTDKLCEKVLQALEQDGCEYIVNGKYYGKYAVLSIREKLEPATCEVKHTEKFGDYYDIKGENFGAGGFAKDGRTKIVLL